MIPHAKENFRGKSTKANTWEIEKGAITFNNQLFNNIMNHQNHNNTQ